MIQLIAVIIKKKHIDHIKSMHVTNENENMMHKLRTYFKTNLEGVDLKKVDEIVLCFGVVPK
jgi:hypothetical protein